MCGGRYEILEPVGSGGRGTVYKAHDAQLNRLVAVKRLKGDPANHGAIDPEEEQKLLNEASLTGAVQHPNVVAVYDGGTDDKGAYLVMEYVDGETVSEIIKRGTLTIQDFIGITTQTLEGLIAAHEMGLIHRDLKPSNVIVSWLPSGTYQVKILDFGMAKYSPTPTQQTEDQNQAIFGTIHFMAPEQFNRQPLDMRTDLYALGCILYYGLAGMLPFQGDDPAAIMKAHLQGRVIPVHYVRRDLPQSLGRWLMRLLARDTAERPRSASDALDDFNLSQTLPPRSPEKEEDLSITFQRAV